MLTATMPAELLGYGLLSGLQAQSEISELCSTRSMARDRAKHQGDAPSGRPARGVGRGERAWVRMPCKTAPREVGP